MATLHYAAQALADIDRLVDFLVQEDAAAAVATVEILLGGLEILRVHPLVGRPVEHGYRELVISRGRSGYLALYRFLPRQDRVDVMAIRHQREAGFLEG